MAQDAEPSAAISARPSTTWRSGASEVNIGAPVSRAPAVRAATVLAERSPLSCSQSSHRFAPRRSWRKGERDSRIGAPSPNERAAVGRHRHPRMSLKVNDEPVVVRVGSTAVCCHTAGKVVTTLLLLPSLRRLEVVFMRRPARKTEILVRDRHSVNARDIPIGSHSCVNEQRVVIATVVNDQFRLVDTNP